MSNRRLSIRRQTSLHSGWLTKQGGMVKSWKPRWFTIKGDHMYYYQKEDEIKLLGDIPLPGNEVVEMPPNPEEPGRYFFQIKPGKDRNFVSTNHAVYILYAKNEAERQEWISVIHRVMYSHIGGGVFGQNIQETMDYERRTESGRVVPRIMEECVTYLREHGLDTEGIFRLPGGAGMIRRLKQAYNSAQPVDLDQENGSDVHSIASLLKLYLRELPEPVIPFKYYEDFTTMGLKIQWDPSNAMTLLHDKLTQLPRDNYNLLKYLCSFLHDVTLNSDRNKMTDSNIAMIFGPNLLRTDDENPMLMLSTSDLNTLTVRSLISDYDQIFQRDYYDPEIDQRRGAVHDINNIYELDLLTGDSPDSSGLPSPILPAANVDLLSELEQKFSSTSSLNEAEKYPDSSEEKSPEDTKISEVVAFRTNSVSRNSRKQLKRFNILSEADRPKPGPKPRVGAEAVNDQSTDAPDQTPKSATKRVPPAPPPRTVSREPKTPEQKQQVDQIVQNTTDDVFAQRQNAVDDDDEDDEEEVVIRRKPGAAAPPDEETWVAEVPPPPPMSSPETPPSPPPMRTPDKSSPPPPMRTFEKISPPSPPSRVSPQVKTSQPSPVSVAGVAGPPSRVNPPVKPVLPSRVVPPAQTTPSARPPVTTDRTQDPQTELETLRSEVEKLRKVQSNLGRIYQRQMDAEISDLTKSHESELEALKEKLKREKQATLLAVERLEQVRTELQRYQLKFGPLLDEDSDDG